MDINRVKYNLGRQVSFDGVTYLFAGCIMRQGEQGFYFQAELKDSAAESAIVIADLKEVEEKHD